VLQASFDPPGLSVAVKKDRAAEPLLAPGAKFVVNILAEGREKPVIKQLLKPFKPGEDRFAGLDTQVRPPPPLVLSGSRRRIRQIRQRCYLKSASLAIPAMPQSEFEQFWHVRHCCSFEFGSLWQFS
jgi:hypothetical protein